MFISGGSAGGHLTALLVLHERFLGKHGLSGRNVRGFMPISGLMDVFRKVEPAREAIWGSDPEVLADASPIRHVREDAPPMLILYAEHDTADRRDQNDKMLLAMKEAGHNAVSLHELKDRTHTSIRPNLVRKDDQGARLTLEFMKKHGADNRTLE